MAYRRRVVSDSDDDSDRNLEDHLDHDEGLVESEEDCGGSVAKKAAILWGDALMEQTLLQRGSRISLEKGENRVSRGVESYEVPASLIRKDKADYKNCTKETEAKEKPKIPANSESPFDDAPIDLSAETAFCSRISEDAGDIHGRVAKGGYKRGFSARGAPGRSRGAPVTSWRGGGNQRHLKRKWPDKKSNATDPGKLVDASYSLETLMALEFPTGITVEDLGDEIVKAMGERDPKIVKAIVNICGVDKALSIFEETRKVESAGGMLIENGRRRRTPGGVFIFLFKLDPDIPENVKKEVFGQARRDTKKLLRAKRRNGTFADELAALAEIMKKEKEKEESDQSLVPLPNVEEVFQLGSCADINEHRNQTSDVEMDI